MKIQFILNPSSGKGKGREILAFLKAEGRALGLRADYDQSASAEEARQIAIRAQDRGCELIVACGGDGTIHSLLPALVGRPAALGVIPIGTANDLARNWGIPFTLKKALKALAQGRPRVVDVIRTNSGQVIAGAAGIGFDAAVVEQAGRLRAVCRGILPFSIAMLSEYARYSPSVVSLRAEGWEYAGPGWQVLLTKIPRYAYIFKITTSVEPDNGKMEICLLPETPKVRPLTVLPDLPFISLRSIPEAVFRTSSFLEVESSPPVAIHGDGDIIGRTPETFRILPKALRVLALEAPLKPPRGNPLASFLRR